MSGLIKNRLEDLKELILTTELGQQNTIEFKLKILEKVENIILLEEGLEKNRKHNNSVVRRRK